MKASPAKLLNVEGEEVAFNKVDTALKSIGISIRDASGQFRDFDDVIMELAGKWDTLDNNTQRYIATIMSGNRQQSRCIALVSNYDELNRAMTTANESENASIV
jgi:TP901 family phage tail tape measure protein